MMRTLGYQVVDLLCDIALSILSVISAGFEWALTKLQTVKTVAGERAGVPGWSDPSLQLVSASGAGQAPYDYEADAAR